MTAYSYVVGALHSPDVDAEMIVQLGSAWGGRGYHSMSRHRGSLLLGAWMMSHAQIRRRLGLVRRSPRCDVNELMNVNIEAASRDFERLEHRGIRESDGHIPPVLRDRLDIPRHAYLGASLRHQVAEAWIEIKREWDSFVTGEEPNENLGINFTEIVQANPRRLRHLSRLLPRELAPLDRFNDAISFKQTHWFSAVRHAASFADVYNRASPAGQAVLLELATEGAGDWLRARPRDPAELGPLYSRYQVGSDCLIHHQSTLLLPITAVPQGCQGCGTTDAYANPRHFASCACGMVASDALHHPVRDLLVQMLCSVYGSQRTLREGGRGEQVE